MSIEVTVAERARDVRRFIDLPHRLYRGDPNYVPQLAVEQMGLLGPRNPFREHAAMRLLLAWRDGRPVGRVAAIDNHLVATRDGCGPGCFGFFDCEDDEAAAGRLLAACREWLRGRGRHGLWGPVNPDLNHSCGVLAEGFDRPPAVFMPYNAPHYCRLLESAGLRVIKRLNAWDIFSEAIPPEVLAEAGGSRRELEARGFRLRPIDFRDFRRDLERLRPVYNDAMAGTWGHTPLSAAEFLDQARGLRYICRPEFVQVAERQGQVVGFIGAAPDLNRVLRRLPRGRLLPWGWARLLAGRRRLQWARIVMYGVLPQHRGTGLAGWLYVEVIRALRARGFAGAEASYVLEDNRPVNELSRRLGGSLAKRYAIYGLPEPRRSGP